MTTEERVRLAIKATACQVSPESLSPLDLEREGRAARQARGETAEATPGPGRWPRARRWLAPAAAAASLLAVAGGLALVTGLSHGTPVTQRGHGLPGNVPPYYVALEFVQPHAFEGPTRAVVASTATGAALATVGVPKPYATFAAVLAAADDRTFVLVAQLPAERSSGYPVAPGSRFFKLTINPAARNRAARAHLVPLPVPAEPRRTIVSSALSPDGSKLAVLALRWPAAGRPGRPRLSVFDLRTGTERTWRSPVAFGLGDGLTWLADNRTLALTGAPFRAYRWQVLLLDTTAPGSSFAADARVAAGISSSRRLEWRQVMITPDGRTLLVVREWPIPKGWPIDGTVRLQRYDVRTGTVNGLVDARKVELGEYDQVQWSSPSGHVLICLVPRSQRAAGPGVHTERGAVIFVGDRRYHVPWARQAIRGAW